MLPFIYPKQDARLILADISSADIPETHKAMFAWIREFTSNSANLSTQHIQHLISLSISPREIVEWANIASIQTWFVMSADGGGIPLEGDAVTGSVVGLERKNYHQRKLSTVAECTSPEQTKEPYTEYSLPIDEAKLDSIAAEMKTRYGFVPNLFTANTLAPHYFSRHALALKLLEKPQSASLDSRLHAMVRRWTSILNQGHYLDGTTQAQLHRQDESLSATLNQNTHLDSFSSLDRLVLKFADKLVRHAYKVTEKDAQEFRELGLDDEAYVDVINTVSIQTSLDRLSNALGIPRDEAIILSKA